MRTRNLRDDGMGLVEILVLGSIVLVLSLPVVGTVLEYQDANERVVEAANTAAQTAARTGDDQIAETLALTIACNHSDCDARSEVNIGSTRVSAYVHRVIDIPLIGPITITSVSEAQLSQFRSGHRGNA